MLDLLRTRRSIRKFTPEPVGPADRESLLEAALRAPSSRGINPWEFILVDDPAIIAQLARAKQHGSQFLGNAPLAMVVCADTDKSDVWVEDCAIAAIVVQLTAVSLGLGSCWAQIRNRPHNADQSAEQYVQEVLGLPPKMAVACILGIGHSAEKKRPVAAAALQREKIHHNRWNEKGR